MGDESALHAAWMSMGSGGTTPCVHCLNVVNKGWIAVDELDGDSPFVDYTAVHSLRQCVQHSRHTITAIMDDLTATKGTISNGEFREKESRFGWHHTMYSLLLDPVLKPIMDPASQNTYDWAHNVLQGMFQTTVYLALKDISTSGFKYTHVHSFLKDWTWPKKVLTRSCTGVEMFGKDRGQNQLGG